MDWYNLVYFFCNFGGGSFGFSGDFGWFWFFVWSYYYIGIFILWNCGCDGFRIILFYCGGKCGGCFKDRYGGFCCGDFFVFDFFNFVFIFIIFFIVIVSYGYYGNG